MSSTDLEPRATGIAAALARMPTGAKVFLILVGALLPLALIALFTTIQTTRTADTEARARLHAVADESSGAVENILTNEASQMRQALAALERDPRDAASCIRLAGSFAAQGGTRFAIADAHGRVLCGQRFTIPAAAALRPGETRASLLADGLAVRIAGNAGMTAAAWYPVSVLSALARPSGFVPDYGAALIREGERLSLRDLGAGGPLGRRETARSDLSLDGLALEMVMPGAPITSPLIITTVLLVLMWIAAAAIGWFVVDILLIRPLRRLRTSVGRYQPGEVLDMKRFGAIPALEIRELGQTFQQITRTVRLHEADLADGLVRQTRLTREVHHRVKNNLQVISSLINFHARGAKSAEATEAYASIQRRVDALAVVHRHHYAELEENRGLDLRSIIGELAANIRATAPERAAGLGITLEIEPLLVNQDVAIAVAFLITELVELAVNNHSTAQVRISIKGADEPDRAILRVISPALVESAELEALLDSRYGRVILGLARQLRTRLHHDPLVGAYEASISITGRP
ncbi:histidine kinase dimerization/phosphoacceptor domain -containing protein [Sphingomonas sp. DG1-23]|jgi:two-component sensor histidine kinase|uniref:sensor histidine kinase n=1 Tax=Sphingomonas sp. DG1-23 TaxID=3068316 RepID=UPI00273EFB93|nr:histidine kinase dimerization/phosphoacceptor domain -containing protein [Sphingomonas sp. DG1-23]MDP5279591.1 histidine kinase dimerization/phosphoacceptor domain -containing protein [Sphingomonas sp. DG1-23]